MSVAIAIESWSYTKEQRVVDWLTKGFGAPTYETWFIDNECSHNNSDLFTLCMTDEIYTFYLLRWE